MENIIYSFFITILITEMNAQKSEIVSSPHLLIAFIMATMVTFAFRMVQKFEKVLALFLAYLAYEGLLIDLIGRDHVEKLASVKAWVGLRKKRMTLPCQGLSLSCN